MAIVSFKLGGSLFLRDPQNTELGQKIITNSVQLIEKLGFEQFTFKKLAEEIDSTEASVYRYFENKHRLLIYLINWYWTWLEHKIDFATNNIEEPSERLAICLRTLTEEKKPDAFSSLLNSQALERIVMSEFEKTYLTKQVDSDNKDGVFLAYKSVCNKVASMVKEVNPTFAFPHALVSTIILTLNHQLFYAEHLPSLTDIKFNPGHHHNKLNEFISLLMFKVLES
jgi:AcrR family transcriptional regulator